MNLRNIRTISLPLLCVLGSLVVSCHRQKAAPLTQRGYLWQRNWTPAVTDAFAEASVQMEGIVILGGEVAWSGATPRLIKSAVRWPAVAAAKRPCAIALRVAPFDGAFRSDDAVAKFLNQTATALLAEAVANNIDVSEFQLDFDCPAKKLNGYRLWVKTLRNATQPVRFVITTLPAWLEQQEFAGLVSEADGYVLQVHSVPLHPVSEESQLCHPIMVQRWISKAQNLGRPFSIALPTYRCLSGYDGAGKLLGVAMDSVQPAWPRGTRVIEFGANADSIADLVRDLQKAHPAEMKEILWYRIPVSSDVRNWRWSTLKAVMSGRRPSHKMTVSTRGENPVDLIVSNNGEAEEELRSPVVATWNSEILVTADALPGWHVQTRNREATFVPDRDTPTRLSSGEQYDIGWLRYDRTTSLRVRFLDQAVP